jgi:hypothetical protein
LEKFLQLVKKIDMKKLVSLSAILIVGLSACTKNYGCKCAGKIGSIVSYKKGEEAAAKKQCEDAGCSFVQY